MDNLRLAEAFKALTDENRITILKTLKKGEMCAGDILELLNITQPTLSHHMKILTEAGLVSARKQSKFTYYSITTELADAILEAVGEIFGVEEVNIRTVVREKLVEAPKKDLPSHLL